MSDDFERPDQNNQSRIDLGLSNFLEGAGRALKETVDEVGDLASVLKNSVEQSLPAHEEPPFNEQLSSNEITDYEKLAAISNWGELSKLCESRMSAQGEVDYEAKLWWIKSQQAARAVPVAILAPSLDGVARAMLGLEISPLSSNQQAVLKRLKPLCTDLLIELAKELQINGDRELSLLFGERAFRAGTEKRAELLSLISSIRDSFNSKGEGPDSTNFQSQLERLEAELSPVTQHEKKLPSAFVLFDKSSSRLNAGSVVTASDAKNSMKRPIFVVAVMVALVIGYLYINPFFLDTIKTETAMDLSAAEASFQLTQNMQSPQVERVEGLRHLDAIYYDMDNISSIDSVDVAAEPAALSEPVSAAPAKAAAAPVTPPSALAQQSSPMPAQQEPPIAKLPQRDRDALERAVAARLAGRQPQKETVNTDYPIEDRRLEQSVDSHSERGSEDTAQKEEMPEIDFPPYRSNSARGREQQAAQAKRPETETYIVIARSKVMDEPSYWASSFADVYPDDKIQVVERQGKWLRVRTPRGRTGYVLAQDAERY